MSEHVLSYGMVGVETIRTMSGLEFLAAIAAGRIPQPPIARTLGFHLAEVAEGRAVFVGRPTREIYNPIGSVHGGFAGALLDSCMSCAFQTTLPQGKGYTTLEYRVHLVRALTDETGQVRAEGAVVHAGRRAGTAEGRIVDAAGRLYAHGTATLLVIDL